MLTAHIVIVNYNSGDWLQRSIASALAHSDASISVVDNDSSDLSMENAQRNIASERVEWIYNSENVGFAAANNQVLRSVDHDYVVLMNPDCELTEGALRQIIQAFSDNEAIGIASCRILNEDGSLQKTCRRRFPTPWSALVRMLMLDRVFPNSAMFADFDYGENVEPSESTQAVEAISGAFMVVKRDALTKVGLLDEGYFMHCEDLDWCKRFALAGLQVGFVPAAEVVHAKGVSSKSRPLGVMWTLHKGMIRFFDKFYHNDYAWPVRYSIKLGILLSFCARAVGSLIKSGLGVFNRS